MKFIRITLLLTLTLAATLLAQAKDNKAALKDLAGLQGDWFLASCIVDGSTIPESKLADARRTCKGDEVTAVVEGELVLKAKISLDPSKKPKAIDYVVEKGPNEGRQIR